MLERGDVRRGLERTDIADVAERRFADGLEADLAFADVVVIGRGGNGALRASIRIELELLGAQHVGEGELDAHGAFHGAAVAEMGRAAGVADAAVGTGERNQLRVGEHRLDQLGAQLVERANRTLSGSAPSRIRTSGVIATRFGRAPRMVLALGRLVGGTRRRRIRRWPAATVR